MRIPLPPLKTQKAIASFLDRKTAAIATLIAKKQRLIQLLAEKRTALIKQVVSRGLNPNAPMKDSGIPWVGKIPKHWGVVRIGYFAQIGNGSTPRRDHAEYWSSEDFPWLNSSKINDEIIQHPDQYVSKQALKECHLPIVPAESVLVAITGEGQTRGRSALLKFAATINQHLAYIKVIDDRLDNEYLRRQLQAAYQWLRSESNGAGSTRAALTCEFLAEMKVLIPPLNEQKKIVHLIDEQIKVIDLLIEKLRLSLMYLEEYRQSLITEAVTGKINVKEGITA
jgi:type I restriction enzyme, S subunit